jgi:hypothetical protein
MNHNEPMNQKEMIQPKRNLIRSIAATAISLYGTTLLLAHNARAASYGFDQVMVKGKKVDIVWTDLMADGRATAITFGTPQGSETRIDLDGDGIPEVRTIENQEYEIEQSHPVHGIYSQMRIIKHEAKRNIISEYRISKNQKSYDLISHTARPYETMYASSVPGDDLGIGKMTFDSPPPVTPSVPSASGSVSAPTADAAHAEPGSSAAVLTSGLTNPQATRGTGTSSPPPHFQCELKENNSPLSTRWQSLSTSLEEQAFLNDPSIKSLVADSCGANKDKILRSLFTVLGPKPGDNQKYFSCMAEMTELKQLAVQIYTKQWSNVTLHHGKSALISCENLPEGKLGSYAEGRAIPIRLNTAHAQAGNSTEITATLFHELIHSKIRDNAAVESIVNCCVMDYRADERACKLKTRINLAAGLSDILEPRNKAKIISSLRLEFAPISKIIKCQGEQDESKTCLDSINAAKAKLISNMLALCKAARPDLNCAETAEKFAQDPTLLTSHLRMCFQTNNKDLSQLGCIYGSSASTSEAYFATTAESRDILAGQPAVSVSKSNGRVPMSVVPMNPASKIAMTNAASRSPGVVLDALNNAAMTARTLPAPQLITEARAADSPAAETIGNGTHSQSSRGSSGADFLPSYDGGRVSSSSSRGRRDDKFHANYDGPSGPSEAPTTQPLITQDGTRVTLASAFGKVVPDSAASEVPTSRTAQDRSPSIETTPAQRNAMRAPAFAAAGSSGLNQRPASDSGNASGAGSGGGSGSDSITAGLTSPQKGLRDQRSGKNGPGGGPAIAERKFAMPDEVTALLASTKEPSALVQLVQQRWFQEQIEKFGIQIVYGTIRYPDHPARPVTKIINLALYLQGRGS